MKFEAIVDTFAERPFFELQEVLARSDDDPKSLKNQLSYWSSTGKVTRLRRGAYLLAEPYRNKMPSIYHLSNQLLRPSYVSLQAGLQHYGMIPEVVGTVTAVSPKHGQTWDTSVGRFKYRSIKQERFWGYVQSSTSGAESPQQQFMMGRPEKCLLDLFYLHKGEWTAERLAELRLQQLERLDPAQLQEDAKRFCSPKVSRACRRLLSVYSEVLR